MKTILHPDYWVEIPAGEFLIGLSETQFDLIRTRIRDQKGYAQKVSPTEDQVFKRAVDKVRQRGVRVRAGDRSAVLARLEYSADERSVIKREPFSSILSLEKMLADLYPQRSIWLDQFYIARFPITRNQYGAFRRGASVSSWPGALEGPAKQIIEYPIASTNRNLDRNMSGREATFPMYVPVDLQYDEALRLCQELGARLPTYLEWEKAALGTDGRLYPWGNEWDPEAGYFYQGQEGFRGHRVDAYPRGVSPYGVWAMVGGMPELALSCGYRPGVVQEGCDPKSSSAAMAWLDHMAAIPSGGNYDSLRPVLAQWPRQQWSGFQKEGDDETDRMRSIQLPNLPAEMPSSKRPNLTADNINHLIPLAELTTEDDHRVGTGEKIRDLAWSSDGKQLATAELRMIWLYRVGVSELRIFEEYKGNVVFHSEDPILVSAGADYRSLCLLNIDANTEVTVLKIPKMFIKSLTISPDRSKLAAADSFGTIKIWDLNAGSELLDLQGHIDAVGQVAFSPDGSMFASASVDGTARLWEVKSGSEIAMLLNNETVPVYDVAFSPDGSLLAAASADGIVRFWDLKHSQEQRDCRDTDGNPAASISFSPDGRLLAVGYSNGMFKVWAVATGEVLTTVQCDMGWVIRVAFNPAGTLLATSSRNVVLWGVSISG